MVQVIERKPTIFGELGKGISRGLSEQIPRELEHQRLRSGLQSLAQKSKGGELSPEEFYAEAAGTYGVTPQMLQGFAELAQMQRKRRALESVPRQGPGQAQAQGQPTQQQAAVPQSMAQAPQAAQAQPGMAPAQAPTNAPTTPASLTRSELSEEIQNPPRILTEDELLSQAAQRFEQNPDLYGQDPAKAYEAAQRDNNLQIAKAAQASNIQSTLGTLQQDFSDKFDKRARELGVITVNGNGLVTSMSIPGDVFNKIRQKGLQDMMPKKSGGLGLSAEQSVEKYAPEIKEIAEQYARVNGLGGLGILSKPSQETLTSIKSLQKEFEKRDDTRNLAYRLQSSANISPAFSYALAQPVKSVPELSKEIKEIPNFWSAIWKEKIVPSELITGEFEPRVRLEKSLEISQKLAKYVKENAKASPLAIAYELQKKGYDPGVWISYLNENAQDLNLRQDQLDQLQQPGTLTGTLNDWWLSAFSGLGD